VVVRESKAATNIISGGGITQQPNDILGDVTHFHATNASASQ